MRRLLVALALCLAANAVQARGLEPATMELAQNSPAAVSGASSPDRLSHAKNLAALRAWTAYGDPVQRDGYATPGDGGLAAYTHSPTACSIPGGDGGSQVSAADGGCWLAALPSPADVRIWGARCDGMTDDAAAINRALAASSVLIPDKACRVAAPVIVPQGRRLVGAVLDTTEPPAGSRIVCASTLSPCVRATVLTAGSTSLGGQEVSHLTITRDPGPIPAKSICFENDSFKFHSTDLNCNGHAIGIRALAQVTYGIMAVFDRLWTCNITDSDVVQDGFAELHVTAGRLGCNGVRAKTHANYVKITGGASGPNTLYLTGTQFNDINNPACWLNWTALTQIGNTTEFHIEGNHLEITGQPGAPHAVFCSDASATVIGDVFLIGNEIRDNNGTSTVWNLNAATKLGDWKLSANEWAGFGTKGWVLAPGAGPLLMSVHGDIFNNGKVSVTGPGDSSSSAINFDGLFYGGLAIGGSFGPAFPARFAGVLGGGTVTNTALSPVEIDIPGYATTSNARDLGLGFGGAAATLGSPSANWTLRGSQITWAFSFAISRMDGAAGPATLSGLPFPVANGPQPVAAIACVGLQRMTSQALAYPAGGTKTAKLVQSGLTGVTDLSAANFRAGSICSGSLTYSIR